MRDPNALLIMLPHKRRAILSDNSCRLYHFEMRSQRGFEYIRNVDIMPTYQSSREECCFHNSKEEPCTQSTEIACQIMRIVELEMPDTNLVVNPGEKTSNNYGTRIFLKKIITCTKRNNAPDNHTPWQILGWFFKVIKKHVPIDIINKILMYISWQTYEGICIRMQPTKNIDNCMEN